MFIPCYIVAGAVVDVQAAWLVIIAVVDTNSDLKSNSFLSAELLFSMFSGLFFQYFTPRALLRFFSFWVLYHQSYLHHLCCFVVFFHVTSLLLFFLISLAVPFSLSSFLCCCSYQPTIWSFMSVRACYISSYSTSTPPVLLSSLSLWNNLSNLPLTDLLVTFIPLSWSMQFLSFEPGWYL